MKAIDLSQWRKTPNQKHFLIPRETVQRFRPEGDMLMTPTSPFYSLLFSQNRDLGEMTA